MLLAVALTPLLSHDQTNSNRFGCVSTQLHTYPSPKGVVSMFPLKVALGFVVDKKMVIKINLPCIDPLQYTSTSSRLHHACMHAWRHCNPQVPSLKIWPKEVLKLCFTSKVDKIEKSLPCIGFSPHQLVLTHIDHS